MRWRATVDDDLDVLEPLDPGTGDPLRDRAAHRAGASGAQSPPALAVVRPRDPRSLRLWLAAGALAVVSTLQFAGAGYLNGVEDDLRELEKTWRVVVAVDEDRAAADRALMQAASEFGDSPGLEQQRELLYDAATARLRRLEGELRQLSVSADPLRNLHRDMLATLVDRRRDFRDETVSPTRAGRVLEIDERLRSELQRWWVKERDEEPAGARLTAARELIERLQRMADERTGLTIGAVARDGLYVIDVDANEIRRRPLTLSAGVTVHPLPGRFVVVDGGRAHAFPTSESAPAAWSAPAEIAVSAGDDETVWVQVDRSVRRLGPDGNEVLRVDVPAGAVLVSITRPDRPLIQLRDGGLQVLTADGQLEEAPSFRRFRRSSGDGSFGASDAYAAGLDRAGRVLLAPYGPRQLAVPFSTLRARVPPFVDLAVLP